MLQLQEIGKYLDVVQTLKFLHKNLNFTVSGRTVKLKFANWYLQNASMLATINVVTAASINLKSVKFFCPNNIDLVSLLVAIQ